MEFQVGEVQARELTRLGTFDIVLLFGLLYHLEDPVAALRLARRLTRRVCLLETQLAPNLAGILDWGTSSTVKSIQGSFAIIDVLWSWLPVTAKPTCGSLPPSRVWRGCCG